MITRRALLPAAGMLALVPRRALAIAPPPDFSLTGTREQGCLMIGKTFEPAQVTLEGVAVHVSSDGYFAFGIAHDRTEPLHYSVILPNGQIENNWVTPVIRKYEIQRVEGLPQNLVTPSPEDLVRIKRENAAIHEARTRDTDGVGFAEPFDWPFPGIISSVYGSQRIENGTPMTPHLGIDIAAPEGTPIHAPADAVVSLSDDYLVDGGFTLLDHGHGVSTCYLHQSKRMAAVGDKVARGDVIGLVGRTGRATGPHTHWGLCWFQLKLDPSRSTRTLEPPKA